MAGRWRSRQPKWGRRDGTCRRGMGRLRRGSGSPRQRSRRTPRCPEFSESALDRHGIHRHNMLWLAEPEVGAV
jgi:hypothetical protein